MLTNIVIDDDLIKKAMEVSGIATQKEVIETALLEFVEHHSRKDLSKLRGKILFNAEYDYKAMREKKS